jgi:hypothetical protein
MMMHRAALLLACCACLVAQTAAVEGVVVNRTTGLPMAGAHVVFLGVSASGDQQPWGAISDRKGHFSIASLPAGTYTAGGEARGFFCVPPESKGPVRLVSLKAGQQIADFKIELVPEATVSGRVFDDNGDPVQANVHTEIESNRNLYLGRWGFDNSDERGEFHLSLAPGKYFVVAEPGGRVVNPVPEIRTDGTVAATYGKTYYPGAASKAKAVLVEATAGAELTGVDIHLARTALGGSVSGTVNGVAEGDGYTMVVLQQVEGTEGIRSTTSTSAAPEGHFLFANLAPGAYRLLALHRGDKTKLFSQPVDVNLEGSDVSGVNLALAPGGDVNGKLELAGGASTEKLSVGLMLKPYDYFGDAAPSAEVDAAGAFHISGIAPGHYRVRVTPLTENAYLKSVRLDDAEASDDDLDFSRATPRTSLKIVVSRNGGQIAGKLLDQDGEPLGAAPAMVVLAADGKDVDLQRSLKVVDDGTYRFQAIRPGKYRLLASDAAQLGWGDELAESVKKLAAAAEEIEIKEGDRKVKDLKLTVKEDADAKAAQ